jgi:hypothetical protein
MSRPAVSGVNKGFGYPVRVGNFIPSLFPDRVANKDDVMLLDYIDYITALWSAL